MRILASGTLGVLIDVQERLFTHMTKSDLLLDRLIILLQGLKILEVPLIVSEQYPKGLGRTIPELVEVLAGSPVFEKISFSCCDDQVLSQVFRERSKQFILVAGIESHVCVQQTVVDLLVSGFVPVVVADCISSRQEQSKEIALARMLQEGARVATCESILFELCREAGTDRFKKISALLK